MATRRSKSTVLLVSVYLISLFLSAEAKKPSPPAKRGPMSIQVALRILRERRKQQFLLRSGQTSSTSYRPPTAIATTTMANLRGSRTSNGTTFVDRISTSSQISNHTATPTSISPNNHVEIRPEVEDISSPSLYNASDYPSTLLEGNKTYQIEMPNVTSSEKKDVDFTKFSNSGEAHMEAEHGALSNSTNNDTFFVKDFEDDKPGNFTAFSGLAKTMTVDDVDNLTDLYENSAIFLNVSIVDNYSNVSNYDEYDPDMGNVSFTSTVETDLGANPNVSFNITLEDISEATSNESDTTNVTSSGLSVNDNTSVRADVSLSSFNSSSYSHSRTFSSSTVSGDFDPENLSPPWKTGKYSETSVTEDFITTATSTKFKTTADGATARNLTYETTAPVQEHTAESPSTKSSTDSLISSPEILSTEQTTSFPKQTTSGYMYRTTEFDPLTNRGGPFLRKPNAYDFLMMGQIATAQRNEKQREFRESNYEASAQICALLNKRFCRLSIGGRCC